MYNRWAEKMMMGVNLYEVFFIPSAEAVANFYEHTSCIIMLAVFREWNIINVKIVFIRYE